MPCSVVKNLEITEGSYADYRQLSVYHYRDSSVGPYVAIFTLRPTGPLKKRLRKEIAGVIVYTTPIVANQLRSRVLSNFLSNLDGKTKLAVINRDIRTISRVIIEPRFRSLGLATRLVAETMDRVDVPIIEAIAVMGHVNPFFRKAGMTQYIAPPPEGTVQLIEAFNYIGICKDALIDAEKVQSKIEKLCKPEKKFIEVHINNFLKRFRKRRNMPPGLERTRYLLTRLTDRPVYYIKIKGSE